MRCVELTEISALMDGELDGRQTESITQHLLQCSECREERDRMLELSVVIGRTAPLGVSSELDDRVMHAYRDRFASPTWTRWLFSGRLALPVPLAAAVLVIIAVVGFAAYRIGQLSAQPVRIAAEPAVPYTPASPVNTSPGDTAVAIPIGAAPPRVITKVVNVCRPSRRTPKGQFIQPVRPPKANPTILTATMTDNGYFTDLRLAGFEPPAELNAHVIKGVKK